MPPSALLVGYATYDGEEHAVMLMKADLAVDADRSGTQNEVGLSFHDQNDRTSEEKPYIFWVNNDRDVGDGPTATDEFGLSDPYNPIPDWQDRQIWSKRDLEDFSRIWLEVEGIGQALRHNQLRLGLRWKNVTRGNPGIQIYNSADPDGGLAYLYDHDIADRQIGGTGSDPNYYQRAVQLRDATGDISPEVKGEEASYFHQFYWNDLQDKDSARRHFIFEASSAGKGELVIVIQQRMSDGSFVDVGESAGVWFDFRDIKELYQHFTVGDDTSSDPATVATEINNVSKSDLDELGFEDDYILFVHGWRMQPWERRSFAETGFKRLWWQGYKGRYGLFSWPTEWTPRPDWTLGIPLDPQNYMRSDHKAMLSGEGLALLMNALMSDYNQSLAVYAHSMGNVTVSEALKLGGTARSFVASQAASVATAYESFGPEFDVVARINDIYGPVLGYPVDNFFSNHPDVFAIYPPTGKNYYDGIRGNVNGPILNFHNRVDNALSGWLIGQLLKPNLGWSYDPGTDEWRRGSTVLAFGADTYEILARAVEPQSVPLGASVDTGVRTGGEIEDDYNLQEFSSIGNFPSLSDFDFTGMPEDHSAQFRSSYTDRYPYWNTVLINLLIE